MAITLQKPQGTDIYNIDIFNQNSVIIEQYLNQFLGDTDISLKVYHYPEFSSSINIDNLVTGVHICDNLQLTNMSGTFPNTQEDGTTTSNVYFTILDIGDTNSNSSKLQIYIDYSYDHNKIYLRRQILNTATWTNWFDISGDGTSGSEITLTLVNE